MWLPSPNNLNIYPSFYTIHYPIYPGKWIYLKPYLQKWILNENWKWSWQYSHFLCYHEIMLCIKKFDWYICNTSEFWMVFYMLTSNSSSCFLSCVFFYRGLRGSFGDCLIYDFLLTYYITRDVEPLAIDDRITGWLGHRFFPKYVAILLRSLLITELSHVPMFLLIMYPPIYCCIYVV